MADQPEWDHEQDLAQLRAMFDQLKAGSVEMADALWTFYAALTDQGFSADQAMVLTMGFFQTLLTPNG